MGNLFQALGRWGRSRKRAGGMRCLSRIPLVLLLLHFFDRPHRRRARNGLWCNRLHLFKNRMQPYSKMATIVVLCFFLQITPSCLVLKLEIQKHIFPWTSQQELIWKQTKLKWRPFGIKIYTGYIVKIDMIHALCYCTTQLRHSASPSPYIWCWLRIPSRRKTQSFIFVVETSRLKQIIFAVSIFNRIPNWTRTLMMTVNQTTEQQQVTSARQALLTPDQE